MTIYSKLLVAISLIFIVVSSGLIVVRAESSIDDSQSVIPSNLESLQRLPSVIGDIKTPTINNPDWLQAELDAEEAAKKAAAEAARQTAAIPGNTTVSYDVMTRGIITTSLSEFKSQANQTLNDSRGWARLGVKFLEVASNGSFTLVLSQASQVPSFNYSVCSSFWSCQVGRYVIINQDRWLGATDSWNQAGGSLRDYRHMVVNHETGHWLGHGHNNNGCSVAGQLAPVMQQQSMDLRGCNFNPWPLNSELWSSRLGI